MPEINADLKDRLVTFAEEFAASTGLDVSVRVAREEPESLTIAFDGPDARFLVGRGGQALDALQTITVNALLRRASSRMHVTFDADNYRERRAAMLIQMAQELATQVASTGQEAVLDPMSSMERRIVHQALLEFPGISTYSEGEDPNRCIVIAPAA